MAAKRGWTNAFFDSLPEYEQVRNIVHDRIANLLEAHVAKVQRDVAEEDGKNGGKGTGGMDPSYNAFSPG